MHIYLLLELELLRLEVGLLDIISDYHCCCERLQLLCVVFCACGIQGIMHECARVRVCVRACILYTQTHLQYEHTH